MKPKPVQKYTTLLSLYLAQSVPMSFFSTVLPVIMRMEDYSLEKIGLIQLVKIPWIIKFLWAPMIDNSSHSNKGYKRWIFSAEIFYALVIISIGFYDLKTDMTTIIILMVLAFVLSATQDIASDAFAVRILKRDQRSYGNSMQSAGNFLGTLFGSGVLLMVYKIAGWQPLMWFLSGIVIIALLPLIFYKDSQEIKRPDNRKRVQLKDVFSWFVLPNISKRLLILMFYYSGIIGILAMLKPYLVDLDYSINQIAFISGIYGTSIGAASAFAGGWIIRRLGNKMSLRTFSLYAFVAGGIFVIGTFTGPSKFMIYAGVTLLWSAYAMSSTIIYTISMNKVRAGKEGTDYTLQIVLTHLSGLIVAVLSGKIADLIEYQGLFILESSLALAAALILPLLYEEEPVDAFSYANS